MTYLLETLVIITLSAKFQQVNFGTHSDCSKVFYPFKSMIINLFVIELCLGFL
jgi:hypothetical protein